MSRKLPTIHEVPARPVRGGVHIREGRGERLAWFSLEPQSYELKVAIVGGGLAGLTCARYLQMRNVKAVVYDDAKRQHEKDYDITLQHYAIHSLKKIGARKYSVVCDYL